MLYLKPVKGLEEIIFTDYNVRYILNFNFMIVYFHSLEGVEELSINMPLYSYLGAHLILELYFLPFSK